MGEDEWQQTRIDLIRQYYVDLYGEEPRETHLKENRKGRRNERRVFRKIDICIELFERSLPKGKSNKRKCMWLQPKELTSQEKFHSENMLCKLALAGRVSASLLRGIELGAGPGQENERKKESNSGELMIEEQSHSQAENNPESRAEAEHN